MLSGLLGSVVEEESVEGVVGPGALSRDEGAAVGADGDAFGAGGEGDGVDDAIGTEIDDAERSAGGVGDVEIVVVGRDGGGKGELADGDTVGDALFGNGEDIDAIGRGIDEIEATAHFVHYDIGRGSAEAVDCAKRRSGGLGEYRSARNQEEGERTEEDRLQEHKRIR